MHSHGRSSSGSIRARAYIDAHVHIHKCFNLKDFFRAAATNLCKYATQCPDDLQARFVLCLTESSGVDYFDRLVKEAGRDVLSIGQWKVDVSDSDVSLLVSHPKFGQLELVAGRQIVTAERLEILALGTTQHWEDGQAIRDVIASVDKANAVPVLPWGFGKWLGARRHTVVSLIEQYSDGPLYLGDNSGRPRVLPYPPEFDQAAKLGMKILPGSDPLPFSSEYDRAGAFGFFVDYVEDRDSVWTSLRELLRKNRANISGFGDLESPIRFLRNQVAMQYVMRVARIGKAS
jgi:hypothetical protein